MRFFFIFLKKNSVYLEVLYKLKLMNENELCWDVKKKLIKITQTFIALTKTKIKTIKNRKQH